MLRDLSEGLHPVAPSSTLDARLREELLNNPTWIEALETQLLTTATPNDVVVTDVVAENAKNGLNARRLWCRAVQSRGCVLPRG